jgi:hypothetical protein
MDDARTPPVGRRFWALVGLVAQVVFVLSWLVAGFWQRPRYSSLAHSISDMYAVGAPNGMFLVVVLTLTGLGTVAFAVLALLPALRSAGWPAVVGAVALVLSIFGVGDVFTPFEREGCQTADAGCTPAAQLAGGGIVDAVLSTVGLFLLVAAGFFLAVAARRVDGWAGWAWPIRWVTITVLVLILATGFLGVLGIGGLLERLLAFVGAAGIAALAVGVLRRTR